MRIPDNQASINKRILRLAGIAPDMVEAFVSDPGPKTKRTGQP